jgi:Protein of unknown function, DUF481
MVHRTSLVLLAASALLAFPRPARAQSVLTTERVDPLEVSGLFASVAAGTTLQGGNADVVKLRKSGATGYRATHSWILLVGGLSYLSSSNKVSTDDPYLQVAYGRFLSPRTRTFRFVQIQNSREQALPHRLLLGNGIRHRFVRSASTHLDLGAGVLWESERLDSSVLACHLPLVRRADCWSHEKRQDGASDRLLSPRMLPR